jgi:hydroxymethylglutaryl-CoA lyase
LIDIARFYFNLSTGTRELKHQHLFKNYFNDSQFHDTFGMGVANVMTALSLGIRTVDSSIGGLGGCPYSPGATGNVATEDVIYALKDSPYTVSGDLDALVDIGNWISGQIGKSNSSKVGTALYARRKREEEIRSKL